ncbi:MAG: ATP-binding protein, partial [Hyphomicrobiales bacterium]
FWGQIRSLVLASAFALALSAVAAFFLARQFLAPVKSLAAGASALAAGDYANRMENDRYDELGDLIEHFNSLAENLEAAENAERQWITDTSHELQTPLAVLRAEIEALQDGVRQPTDSVLAGLHSSIMRLSYLVGDINTLSRTREGSFSLSPARCDLRDIIDDAVEVAKPGFDSSNLLFKVICNEPLMLDCDRHRIRQLLDNLLENARRYTAGPGKVILVAKSEAASISISLDDTAPCPPENVIERLFERFYRVEASRSREHGGSGLGLSICKAIVIAHDGTIEAKRSDLGGLKVAVMLPQTRIPPEKKDTKDAG